MESLFSVWVASSSGWVRHGRPRSSETQAKGVAASLARRLGWATCAAVAPPEPCPASSLAPALAGCSPVWRDPGLAVAWAAACGRPVRGGHAPAPAPAAAAAPAPRADSVAEDLALVLRARAAGLVL